MNRVLRNTGFYLLIFLVVIGIVKFISSQNEAEAVLPYSEFRAQLAESARLHRQTRRSIKLLLNLKAIRI